MNTATFSRQRFYFSIARWHVVFALGISLSASLAAAQILSVPYPEPSTNGALHYNRALLAMSVIPVEDREVLVKPIWEAFGDMSKEEISQIVSKLAYEGRHAIRAAVHGSEQGHAEFGIDYADYGHGAVLPHAQPMLQLGRLVTLAGIQAQIEGRWEDSAQLFFKGMRMGRHMTNQPTLVDTLIGIEILENNYYALAFWASKCPDIRLVKQAFLRFDIAARTMVQPVKTLAYEASIIQHQIDRLKNSFPDGPWSEMLLESLGELSVAGDRAEHEAQAKKLCSDRGVPESVFADKASFDAFVDKISKLQVTYLQASAVCMDLPPQSRLKRAKAVMDVFGKRFSEIGDQEMLNIQQLASFFATHDAEQTMVRTALAVAAKRQDEKFPASLQSVANLFHGHIPTSPYDGSQLEYSLLSDGKDFSVAVPEVELEGVKLPRVEFSSLREGA